MNTEKWLKFHANLAVAYPAAWNKLHTFRMFESITQIIVEWINTVYAYMHLSTYKWNATATGNNREQQTQQINNQLESGN